MAIAVNRAKTASWNPIRKRAAIRRRFNILDSYKPALVNSLTGNLQRFGFEKVARVETLKEIIDDMSQENAS